ncbi:MAG: arginine repressor [Acidimicrobiales bacterium]
MSEVSQAKISKARRQHLIGRFLGEHEIASQDQLVELLATEGVAATQATVSRDLEEVGAVKVRVPGVDRLVYVIAELPRDQVAPADHLRRVLGEWVVEVSWSHNIVVLRTPPGSAHVVASALDRSGIEGALGTVAGDDTVLVIAAEDTGGASLAEQLTEIAGQ